MAVPLPTLTAGGWATDVGEKADKLMGHYLASDHSQTTLYGDNVVSLAYHVQQTTDSDQALKDLVNRDLTLYFRRYFDDVIVNCDVDHPDPVDSNKYTLNINVRFSQDGTTYSLGREIQVQNSVVTKIAALL